MRSLRNFSLPGSVETQLVEKLQIL